MRQPQLTQLSLLLSLLLTSTATAQSPSRQAASRPAEWTTLRVADAGFAIDFPREPHVQPLTEDAGVDDARGRTYVATTSDEQVVMVAQFADLPVGKFIVEPSQMAEMAAIAVGAMGGTITAMDSTPVDGYFSRAFTGTIGDSMAIDGRLRLRGNRSYLTVVLRRTTHDEAVSERFLSSFRMIELRKTQWIDVEMRDRGYEVRLPSTPLYEIDTMYGGRAIRSAANARDNNTGQSFSTARYTFSEYYSAPNLDSHMLQFVTLGNTGGEMRIVRDSVFTRDGHAAREVQIERGSERLPQRFVYVARGRQLFELTTLTTDTAQRASVDEFLASVHLIGDEADDELTSSRSQRLIEDLSSTDTVRRDAARKALAWYRPPLDELPMFVDALTRRYDDDDVVYFSTATRLLAVIERANDSAALEQVRLRYPSLSNPAKTQLLYSLLRTEDERSINRFIDLATSNPVEYDVWGGILYWPFDRDHKDLYEVLIPRIYSLLDSVAARASLLRLTLQAHHADAIDVDDLDERDRLLRIAGEALESPDDSSGMMSEIRSVAVALLHCFDGSDDVVDLLTRYAVDTAKYNIAGAVQRLIELDAPVPAESMRTLALDRMYRLDLYTTCRDNDRVELFPRDLLRQDLFAESLAHAIVAEEDTELADSIELVESRIVDIEELHGRVYLYRSRASEDSWLQTLLVGLQPESESDVATTAEVVVFGEDRFADLTVDEHFEKLIEQARLDRIENAKYEAEYEDD